MKFAKKRVSLVMLAAIASSIGLSPAAISYAPPPGVNGYALISESDLEKPARTALKNAVKAGRMSKEEETEFAKRIDGATSLSDLESAWADLEARAQEAKAKHVTIDSLIDRFSSYLNQLQRKGIVTNSAAAPYLERLKAIKRVQKQFLLKDNFYDFWEFVILSLDLSSIEERLYRALASYQPMLEPINELVLRTDNYLLRNQVTARGLTVYKSFEPEPAELYAARDSFLNILKDKANSRLETPTVKKQIYKRLRALHYEPYKGLPLEADIDKAIIEVQRLIDSGARNGNLSAQDNVRLQHELELVKQIKNSYPGPNPGIDPVEKELRAEEVRFMCLDLRFLQNWLGRVLRKDGDNDASREELSRLLNRIDLAFFTHRISGYDMAEVMSLVDRAIKDAKTPEQLTQRCRDIQGQLDMMISDYSMAPAQTEARVVAISRLVGMLGADQSGPRNDLDRIQRNLLSLDKMDTPARYGKSLVYAAELEMVRSQVNQLLKAQRVSSER